MNKSIDLKELLSQITIRASAPGRIDSGYCWDLKALALPYETINPSMVNIALDLRTVVSLSSFDENKVCIHSHGFSPEVSDYDNLPLDSDLGFIFAIASYFNVSGLKIDISTVIPPRSGLGGSGVVAITVIAAISKCLSILKNTPLLSGNQIALLANSIEDGMGFSLAGLQDQLAGIYGGVNKWTWIYSRFSHPYDREVLLHPEDYAELGKKIVIAYSGEIHKSSNWTSLWVKYFLRGVNRKAVKGIKQSTENLAQSLMEKNWTLASSALNQEASIIEDIMPNVFTSTTYELMKAARQTNCGSRFTGAGGGGGFWAIGEEDNITVLKKKWESIIQKTGKGYLLPNKITDIGLIIEDEKYH